MLSGSGIVNEILMNLHVIAQPINFAHPNYFWPIVAFANVEGDRMECHHLSGCHYIH